MGVARPSPRSLLVQTGAGSKPIGGHDDDAAEDEDEDEEDHDEGGDEDGVK